MMSVTKASGFESDDFLSGLVTDLQTTFAQDSEASDIVEFVENVIDRDQWGITLDPRQMLILKCFYCCDLTDEDLEILESLAALDRTNFDIERYKREGPTTKLKQALVLECGRRGGKCHSLNTLLSSKDYGMVYGYELMKEAMSVSQDLNMLTLEEGMQQLKDVSLPLEHIVAIEGTSKTATAQNFYVKGKTKTKKVKTACNYGLEATPEHRIKVLDAEGVIQWRYFRDIQVGEWVCIHRATNLFPLDYLSIAHLAPTLTKYGNGFPVKQREYPEFLDPSLGLLLGLLVGDGSWTSTSQIQLTTHVKDIDWYKQVVTNTGLEDPKELRDKRSQFGSRLSIGCKTLRNYFNALGFVIESEVTTKRVPWSIRRSPKDVQAAFLSGLFAADGSSEKGGREVTLSTASKQLANEVQLLLLNFGIISRVKTKLVNGNDYYILILRGQRSLKRFATEIGFGLPRKQQPLLDYLAQTSRDGGDTERIPNQREWLLRLRDTLPSNRGKQPGSAHGAGKLLGTNYATDKPVHRNLLAEFRAIVGNSIKESCTEHFSSYRLPELIKFAEEHCADQEAIEHFKHLQDCDYFYDQVESVEDSEAFCVDLSVPGHEQYVAQGFTNHNTLIGAIIIAFEFYKLCLKPSPQKYYKIGGNTPIVIYCIATGAEQTKKTIYGQARALLSFVPALNRLIKSGQIIIGETEVKYPAKLLYIFSGNSKSSSQVGSSVILLVMDEVARFNDDKGESNAIELWSNIGVSGVTFGAEAKRVAISSGWRENDAIEQLYNLSKKLEVCESFASFRLRSWDLNPVLAARDSPIVASEYARNARQAALEFEGVRHTGENAFFDEKEVDRAFRGLSCLHAARCESKNDGLVRLEIKSIEDSDVRTYMHLDPAVKRDAYAMAFGHLQTRIGEEPVVIVDGLLCWEPDPHNQVSITNVQNVIYDIHKHRHIYKVTADHQHSPETMERLRASGLDASTVYFSRSIQLEMYDCLRKLLHEDRIYFPRNSAWSLKLKDELINLQLINAVKIDHRPDKCLVGETRIPLLDGTTPMISELVDKEVWVYSCKADGTIVPGKARGRKTMEVTELLDVVLDNGCVIRCTPEHPFMLRNGEYIQAKDIVPNITRLMPVTTLGPAYGATAFIEVTTKQPIPVYDLEVDVWDNFALTAGIIVHNSKDLSDCVAAIAWQLVGTAQSNWVSSKELALKVPTKPVPAAYKMMASDNFSDAHRELTQLSRSKRTNWDSAFSSLDD